MTSSTNDLNGPKALSFILPTSLPANFYPQHLDAYPSIFSFNLLNNFYLRNLNNILCEEATIPNSSTSSSRSSSPEMIGKIRRGRPQQTIEDASDAQSQKKKNRRIYARKYRAEIRQKVEKVKTLNEQKESLEAENKQLRLKLAKTEADLAQKDALISILQLSIPKYS